MKSPFTQFQGGGIEPNQNIAATGRYLGDMAQKSFADAGQQLAEGLKQYQKNAAEDDFLTETLSLQATELSKWSSIISQDPKYAPMLDGLMPMMEKAGKGPSMGLNQKSALSRQLGAFLKAIPDDLSTIDRVSANQEKQANDAAEAGGVAQGLAMFLPSLNNSQNKKFYEQGARILQGIKSAGTPAEQRRAVVEGKAYLNNLGSALQLQESALAREAQAIATDPRTMAAANTASFVGEKTQGIAGISLVGNNGVPLTPNQAIQKYDAKVAEAKDANPSFNEDPQGKLKFLSSMLQGIQNSQAPQNVKDEWSKAVTMYAGYAATRDYPELKNIGEQTYGGYGDKSPTSALTEKTPVIIPEGVKMIGETIKQKTAEFTGKPQSESPLTTYTGKKYSSEEEELKNLASDKAKSTGTIVEKLASNYWSENPNGNAKDAAIYVAENLRDAKLISADGLTLGKDAKSQQAYYNDLVNRATAFAGEDISGDLSVSDNGYVKIGATAAAAGGGVLAYKKGPEKWNIGGFGTSKYTAGLESRLNALIEAERKRFISSTSASNKEVNLAARSVGATGPNEPTGTASITNQQKELVLESTEGKALAKKFNLIGPDGKPLGLNARTSPKVLSRVGEKNLVKFEKELLELAVAKMSPVGTAALRNLKGNKIVAGSVAAYLATRATVAAFNPEDSTPVKDYKLLWGDDGVYQKRLKELGAKNESIKRLQGQYDTGVKAAEGEQVPRRIAAPMSLPVENVLRADLYKAATREQVIQRTADAISSTFGFQYSNAREIAEKYNPQSDIPQIVSAGGREFLATKDAKTNRLEYKELSAKDTPDSQWHGNVVPQEVVNPDGSRGFTMGVQPRVYDKLAVGVKYPSYYSVVQKKDFDKMTVATDQSLKNVDLLIKAIEDGGVRLTNREAAATVAALASTVQFSVVKTRGTPPISNTELEQIGNAIGTEDPNAFFTLDNTNLTKLRILKDGLKSDYRAEIVSMGGQRNQVSFLDEITGTASNSPVAKERATIQQTKIGK
jgi:hypothetical protein